MLSLITPTEGREEHLRLLHTLILEQTHTDWEWLIYDTNYKPSPFFNSLKEPQITYYFSQEILSIGEKRNRLCQAAKGQSIVHLDDDDYYTPNYLSKIAHELEKGDFFHFDSWYCYDVHGQTLYYCAAQKSTPTHFVHNPLEYKKMQEISVDEVKENSFFYQKLKYGYGFAYAYHKKVWEQCPFETINFGEDLNFAQKVVDAGFSTHLLPDQEGHVLHMLHDNNTSRAFPQYRLPTFLIHTVFPKSQHYLKNYPL